MELSDLFAYAVIGFAIAEALLEVGAVYYAFRLTRLVGAFAAWVLLIAALLIMASHSVATIVQLTTQLSFQQLSTLTDGMSPAAFVSQNASAVALSTLFFGAMFALHGKFKQQLRR